MPYIAYEDMPPPMNGPKDPSDAERKAYNLHVALRSLLDAYLDLQKDTNREPLDEDSENNPDKRAERALYDNAPLADWEPK